MRRLFSGSQRVQAFNTEWSDAPPFPSILPKLFDQASGAYLSCGTPAWLASGTYPGQGASGAFDSATRFAVIDSGVVSGHPLIAPCLEAAVDFTGGGAQDEYGHGTWVSLVLIAHATQPVRILSARVLTRDGTGNSRSLVKAIKWAIGQRVAIINLSVGVNHFCWWDRCAVCRAAAEAVKAGIFVTAAGGNTPGKTACPAKLGKSRRGLLWCIDPSPPNVGKATVYFGGRVVRVIPHDEPDSLLRPERLASVRFQEAVRLHHEVGDIDAARRVYEDVASDTDADEAAEATFRVGLLSRQKNELKLAERWYLAAMQRDHPEVSPKAAYMLGRLYTEGGRTRQAEHAYEFATTYPTASYNEACQLNLGVLLRDRGEETRAFDAYKIARTSRDLETSARAAYNIGVMFAERNERDQAFAELSYAATLGPADVRALAEVRLAELQSGLPQSVVRSNMAPRIG